MDVRRGYWCYQCNSRSPQRWLLPIAFASLLVGACTASQGGESVASVKRTNPMIKPVARSGDEMVFSRDIPGNPIASVDVRFSSEDSANPACTLEIVESGVLVAKNSKLLECGLLSSREMVDVDVSGSAGALIVFQQKTKGTNSYSLKRVPASGDWMITKVEFVYPRDNAQTGEVELVRDSADLTRAPISVNSYSPAAIKARLVQSLIQ